MRQIQFIPRQGEHVAVEEPRLVRRLFQSTGVEITSLWLLVRLAVGWYWMNMGWQDLAEPGRLESLAQETLARWTTWSQPAADDYGPTADWLAPLYLALIAAHAETLVVEVLAIGELLMGAAVIVGLLVGAAATVGVVLSLTGFSLTGGSASGILLALPALGLILAWRNAGYLGLDRYLLRALGAPWWGTPTEFRPVARPPA